MIGVDANVLLRLFVVDDTKQHEKAVAFFAMRTPDDPAYVDLLALAELVWLMNRRYGYRMEDIATVIADLLDTSDVVVERSDMLAVAIRQMSSKVGLVDLLIATKGVEAGASRVVTFDRNAAQRIPGMELLK